MLCDMKFMNGEVKGFVMNRRMIKNMIVILLLFCFFCVSGCGASIGGDDATNAVSGNSATSENPNDMLSIDLYFVNKDWTSYFNENLEIDQLTTTENVIDNVMNHLITPKTEGEAWNPLPEGTTYQRYTFDGEGNITLVFNVDYSSTDSYQFLLAKSAFVKTLCQIDGVDTVIFELVDLLDNQSIREEVYHVDSFVYPEDTIS